MFTLVIAIGYLGRLISWAYNGDYDTLNSFEEPNYFDGDYKSFLFDNSSHNVD